MKMARSKYKGLVTSVTSFETSHQALIFRPRAIFNGTAHRSLKLSVREYKDLYANPSKSPEKMILRKDFQLKSLTLFYYDG